jgi:DNA ligase D-like protein (predicted ligase)
MLPALAPEPFDSPDHLFELKWGGVRALAFVRGGRLRLQGSNLRDITALFPELAELPSQLRAGEALLDGEIVALGPQGYPDFDVLRSRLNSYAIEGLAKPREAAPQFVGQAFQPGRGRRAEAGKPRLPGSTSGSRVRAAISYQAFDLLFLKDRPLLNRPLRERRAVLQGALDAGRAARPCDFIENDGIAFFEAAVEHKLEGIVAKEKDSLYFPGKRSSAWLEVRSLQASQFVIGGYTFGGGARRDAFHGLLLGAYRRGQLRYAGHATGGYSEREARGLAGLLSRLHAAQPPFADPPAIQRLIFWVRPEVVCQVRFSHWGPQGRLRFPVFMALRPDLSPEDCTADEVPLPPPWTQQSSLP